MSEESLIGGDCCSLKLGTWSTQHSLQPELGGVSFLGDSGLNLSQAAWGLCSLTAFTDREGHSEPGQFWELPEAVTFLLKDFSHSMRFFQS